jgi:multisubunit Na+/H+ antiporter MnhC subunit
MVASTTAARQQSVLPASPVRRRVDATTWAPTAFAVLNGIAFLLVRPDVNDLWAARARASAVSHGVGLTYWFSWFGGGSTPGNYSVVTPYLSAAVGTEVLGALSAVAVTVLVTLLVRGTNHPHLASSVAAVAAGLNLWSGRVPFLLGSAIAIGAVIAVRRGNRCATVGLTLVSILASPVSGAFLVMGLSGTFLTTRTRGYRPIIAYSVVTTGAALVLVALTFGTPGPEPFSDLLTLGVLLGLGCLWLACTTDHLRTTIGVSVLAAVVLWAIPNGLGSNFARFVWFCLPVAVVALSTRRVRTVVLAVAPLLVAGGITTVTDLRNAQQPVSSVSYYRALAARLDKIPDLRNYRVEVVNHGAHAGYDALLDHAMLARGWETQEDNTLNKSLNKDPLDPVTYKVWLDNNAVGYVALPSASVGGYPEYTLVQKASAPYLHRIWSNDDWELYRVTDPTPIIGLPASVLAHDQKSMTIKVPCTCTIAVRLRWSKFLAAALQRPDPAKPGTIDSRPALLADVADDGSGWTLLTTTRPGTYELRGSLRGLLR